MVKLSFNERWILSNQYLILEKLDKDNANHYAQTREALDSDYEEHYDWNIPYIVRDKQVMTEEESKEVMDILDMFGVLHHAYDQLSDKSGVDENRIRFRGFDGNNETKQLGYTRYLQSIDRFSDLKSFGDGLNSHMPVFDRYKNMASRWEQSTDQYHPTEEDLIRIGEATNKD